LISDIFKDLEKSKNGIIQRKEFEDAMKHALRQNHETLEEEEEE